MLIIESLPTVMQDFPSQLDFIQPIGPLAPYRLKIFYPVYVSQHLIYEFTIPPLNNWP